MKSIFIQQILSGSSFVSPALGGVGQGRLNINDNFPPKKILTKSKQAGKKKRGSGENEFLPTYFVRRQAASRWGGFLLVRTSANWRIAQKRFALRSAIATKEKYSLNPPSFVATPKQIC